jgi:hypothetical protein
LTEILLGSVAWACCMPCHDEKLNDLSSMPPVSVTMQPRNFPAVVPPVPELALGLDDGVPVDPQPAASSTLAVAAATAMIDLFNSDLLDKRQRDAAAAAAGSTLTPAGPGD